MWATGIQFLHVVSRVHVLTVLTVCSTQLDLAVATPLCVPHCPAGLRHFSLQGNGALAQGSSLDKRQLTAARNINLQVEAGEF